MSKFFSSLVLAFLLFVASSHASKVVNVGDLCAQAKWPKFCLVVLRSNPSDQKDLISLAESAIDVIRATVPKTTSLLKSLIAKSVDDPNLNAHYKSCLQHFEVGVAGDIKDTEAALKSGDYVAMNLAASSVYDEVDECVSGDPGDPPFSDHSLLPKYARYFVLVTDVILVITNNLKSA